MHCRPCGYLLLLLTLTMSSGASCRSLARKNDPLAPVVFVGPATLNDVVYAVNTNTAAVQQLSTQNATVSTAGLPSLRATMAVERPRRFRLRASLPVVGPELDVGSNDQLFWLWMRSDPERAIYYGHHDDLQIQATGMRLPIGPDWLIDALGLVYLDPAGSHEGPVPRTDQHVEIRSRIERGGGVYTRSLVLDGKHGWILTQQIWDQQGRLLASAHGSEHRFYEQSGASLPHRVQIEFPPAQLSLKLEVGQYVINQLPGDPVALWSMPSLEGYQPVNIGRMSVPGEPPPSPTSHPSAGSVYDPRTAYRPRYRGLPNYR